MVLGITGISGSGKHTASKYFQKKGWVVLDADEIAHYLYRPYTSVWKAVTTEFGEKILNQDDTINRQKISQIVFNPADPESAGKALKKLNEIIHPYVRRHIENEIHHQLRRKTNIVIVVALWRESGLDDMCNKILVVKATPELRVKRIQGRDGVSQETYNMRIKNQNEPEKSDFVVENNGTVEELNKKLDGILTKLTPN